MHSNTQALDVARGVAMINHNLSDLGWTPRDADGNDFQRGADQNLRFKTGTSYGEVTTLVVVGGETAEALRATSWAGIDRMLLKIRFYIDHTSRYAG